MPRGAACGTFARYFAGTRAVQMSDGSAVRLSTFALSSGVSVIFVLLGPPAVPSQFIIGGRHRGVFVYSVNSFP
ncbi:hypothetical protein FMEAI12_1720005 [Parafrankia sp. Ea1.12]|nr:hypothetical protein FMEAI12_1720005 [Parafrankia sp. Ea1.12]